jgi:hypothetical protein
VGKTNENKENLKETDTMYSEFNENKNTKIPRYGTPGR